MMVSAALSAVVFVLLAASIAGLYSGAFSMLESSKMASAAQRYAEIEANTLSLLPYDEVNSAAHGKANIAGAAGWQSEVLIGAETVVGEENRRRVGEVRVYKSGESIARASLQVPLSYGEGGSGNKFFAGWETLTTTEGIAKTDGILVAISYGNTTMNRYTNGQQNGKARQIRAGQYVGYDAGDEGRDLESRRRANHSVYAN